jgi:alanine-glyoxylate transaminase/serine-glyoxylate transaminase/serine-pyruvate transaminase
MRNPPMKLMIPGPIQPAPEVLLAMAEPVTPHYGPTFTRFYNETLELLREVYNTQGDIFIMVGSSTVGIDACLGSAFSSGEKILVGINGFFGERLKSICESYNLQVVPVNAKLGQPLLVRDFEVAFVTHPDARGAAIVHLETSTTIVNPVEQLAVLCRARDKVIFVDSVSSLGGLPMEMDSWGIDMCVSGSQKCLGAPPGLATVAVGRRAWEEIDRDQAKGHGFYGNLPVWRQYAQDWADWHPFPITMATNNLAALNLSLKQLLAEGISQRLDRYHQLALRLRSGLRRIGFEPFTSDELMASVVTAAYVPQGVKAGDVVEYASYRHNIKISAGLGELKDRIIRIGHMSPGLTEVDIDEVILALSKFPN